MGERLLAKARAWRHDESGFIAALSAILLGLVLVAVLPLATMKPQQIRQQAKAVKVYQKHRGDIVKAVVHMNKAMAIAARRARTARRKDRAYVFATEMHRQFARRRVIKRMRRALKPFVRDMRKAGLLPKKRRRHGAIVRFRIQ